MHVNPFYSKILKIITLYFFLLRKTLDIIPTVIYTVSMVKNAGYGYFAILFTGFAGGGDTHLYVCCEQGFRDSPALLVSIDESALISPGIALTYRCHSSDCRVFSPFIPNSLVAKTSAKAWESGPSSMPLRFALLAAALWKTTAADTCSILDRACRWDNLKVSVPLPAPKSGRKIPSGCIISRLRSYPYSLKSTSSCASLYSSGKKGARSTCSRAFEASLPLPGCVSAKNKRAQSNRALCLTPQQNAVGTIPATPS